ncbi:Na+/H+ antiporter NhaA [Derxia gummosa]|uniref:Na(+)/H(+) antiporter NhaA n=1 Tax=Derxia gummosa DSM 723 TaxID=1121388 RepID=A0A8B6XBR0_9BURK|nr:Na+/H+ antiporter NhaA [Derxia gummosa]
MLTTIRKLFAHELAGGTLLMLAAVAGLIVANSPWREVYESMLALPGEVRVGSFALAKPALVWVNDLWMAAFFLLVGCEIKREVLVGQLSSPSRLALPTLAAIGGMAVPAGIYAFVNRADPVALQGWAIPSATDIAFALGVVALLGSRVPASLRVFLTAVAIIDDLGAIIVIALFYTAQLSMPMLAAAGVCIALLALMNRLGVRALSPYLVVGAVMWVCVLKSGVHATLAGVATALAVPLREATGRDAGGMHAGEPPLEVLEHALAPWIAFLVLPVFAFMNAGVSLQGVSLGSLAEPVALGIAAGLVAGKTIGVLAASGLAVATGMARLPDGMTWTQQTGAAVLCGIGFTMSLFIGSLAFGGAGGDYEQQLKLGVLAGSVVAALIGCSVLMLTGGRR